MCRLVIVKASPVETPQVVHSSAQLVSAGAKLHQTGQLDTQAIKRIMQALESYAKILKQFRVQNCRCVATAVFRMASNVASVQSLIYKKHKMYFHVIDAGDEIFLAALGCFELLEPDTVVVDMGGGSTEIGCISKQNSTATLQDWISLPYGLFSFNDTSLYPLVETSAHKAFGRFASRQKETPIVLARSGLVTLLARYLLKSKYTDIKKIHGYKFSKTAVIQALHSLLKLDIKRLYALSIGKTKSSISIKPNLAFLQQILKQIPSQTITFSMGGVREGLLRELMLENQNYQKKRMHVTQDASNK